MSITLQLVSYPETDILVPLLRDADEDEQHIRTILADAMYTSYAVLEEGNLIGAATVRWEQQESEIEYIAIASHVRGQGYGHACIAALLREARRRCVLSVLVGTDNTSLDNIAFYQNCGFRMDSVRRDYFSYVQPPIVRNGIPMRDMLVLRYEIINEAPS